MMLESVSNVKLRCSCSPGGIGNALAREFHRRGRSIHITNRMQQYLALSSICTSIIGARSLLTYFCRASCHCYSAQSRGAQGAGIHGHEHRPAGCHQPGQPQPGPARCCPDYRWPTGRSRQQCVRVDLISTYLVYSSVVSMY